MSQSSIAIKLLSRSRRARQIQGTTLAEVLVAIVVIGVLAAIAAPNVFSQGSKPLPDTVNQVAGVLRQARSMAIAQTSPIKVRSRGNVLTTDGKSNGGSRTQLEILRATSTNTACNSETGWRPDGTKPDGTVGPATLSLDYLTFATGITPRQTTINGVITQNTVQIPPIDDATAWQICFNTRGTASTTKTSTTNFQGDDVILTFQQASPAKTQALEIFPTGVIQVNGN
jgi:prepilin-type N-terminal cleavage/methylation domain-containing protein